jgi:hypothetical protein
MKPEHIERLRKIASEIQDLLKEVEQGEVTENSPVVLHSPPMKAKEKKRMLEDRPKE